MIRTVEANAVDKLGGISAARDVDLDLLRMVLRLLVMRAMALELLPKDDMGSGKRGQHEDEHGAEAREEMRKVSEVRKWRLGVCAFITYINNYRRR